MGLYLENMKKVPFDGQFRDSTRADRQNASFFLGTHLMFGISQICCSLERKKKEKKYVGLKASERSVAMAVNQSTKSGTINLNLMLIKRMNVAFKERLIAHENALYSSLCQKRPSIALLNLVVQRKSMPSSKNKRKIKKNKAGYTAQDAPSMHTFHLRK